MVKPGSIITSAIVTGLLFGLVLLAPVTVQADTAVLQQAELLLNNRQPVQAAALLADYEDKLGQQPNFAYLYGLALFESDKAEEAIPYLEIATKADPMFAGVRIELARAYYKVGRYTDAQKQFEYLTTQNPPPTAQRAIDEYLAAIDIKLAQSQWRANWRVAPTTGWDTNANAATELNDFLGFTLDQRSRQAESTFLDIYGSGNFSRSLGGGRSIRLGAELQGRHYPDASFADSLGIVGKAGMTWSGTDESRSLRLRSYRMNVDDDFNNQGLSLEGAWDYNVTKMNRVGMFARVGVLRFDDEFDNRDVDQLLVGISATSVLGAARRVMLTVSTILGTDSPKQDGSRYGRDVFGVRGYAAWRINAKFAGRASAGWQRYLYDDAFFPEVDTSRRADRVSDGAVSLVWKAMPNLEATLGVSYRDNRSNVDLFTYDRWVLSLGFSRGW